MRNKSISTIPEERQESTQELAVRQHQERKSELTYSENDQKRWEAQRERVEKSRVASETQKKEPVVPESVKEENLQEVNAAEVPEKEEIVENIQSEQELERCESEDKVEGEGATPAEDKVREAFIYRLDLRPPSIVLSEGFTGSAKTWQNSVFGSNSIFASKSLKGIACFELEALHNKKVDGSPGKGALFRCRNLYPENKEAYVYKINTDGLEYINVVEDLRELVEEDFEVTLFDEDDDFELYDYDDEYGSKLYTFRVRKVYEHFGPIAPHDVDSPYLPQYAQALKSQFMQLLQYRDNVASYTEELIVKGPIAAENISLDHVIPARKQFASSHQDQRWPVNRALLGLK